MTLLRFSWLLDIAGFLILFTCSRGIAVTSMRLALSGLLAVALPSLSLLTVLALDIPFWLLVRKRPTSTGLNESA